MPQNTPEKKKWPMRPGPTKPAPDDKRCTAMSKQTGQRCGAYRKQGYTVCHRHGANPNNRGGAPKGNKNRVTTGEHESILKDTLTPEERGLFDAINVDKVAALDEQIRLSLIRERRMLQRIAKLAQVNMTVVERVYDISKEREDGALGNQASQVLTEKSRGTLGQIQVIEEALTRVQDNIRKLIVDKHRIETGAPPDGDELDRLFDNMRRSRERAAEGGEPDGD